MTSVSLNLHYYVISEYSIRKFHRVELVPVTSLHTDMTYGDDVQE